MKTKSILLALAIFILFFGCQARDSGIVPDELVGVWVTSAPKYKDCAFELTDDLIVFMNGYLLEKIFVNFISRIEKIPQGKHIMYTIHYEDIDYNKYKLAFYYNPSEGGRIRFKHRQRIEWRKKG